MPDHKKREESRQYVEHFCDEPSCEFFGERAVQGVCHSTEPEVAASWERLADAAQNLADELKAIRAMDSYSDPNEYIRWLEAMYETSMMNWSFCLDECIRLRAELARLKKKHEDSDNTP